MSVGHSVCQYVLTKYAEPLWFIIVELSLISATAICVYVQQLFANHCRSLLWIYLVFCYFVFAPRFAAHSIQALTTDGLRTPQTISFSRAIRICSFPTPAHYTFLKFNLQMHIKDIFVWSHWPQQTMLNLVKRIHPAEVPKVFCCSFRRIAVRTNLNIFKPDLTVTHTLRPSMNNGYYSPYLAYFKWILMNCALSHCFLF